MTTPIPGSPWSTTAGGALVESVSLIDSAGNAVGTAAVALLASAARTTTQTSADQTNGTGRAIHVILDATVNAGGLGSVTVTINGKDPASGKYYLLLAGAAVVTVTTNVYRIGPGLTAVANAAANDVIPRIFQIVVTANNANPVTYSVGYNLTA